MAIVKYTEHDKEMLDYTRKSIQTNLIDAYNGRAFAAGHLWMYDEIIGVLKESLDKLNSLSNKIEVGKKYNTKTWEEI